VLNVCFRVADEQGLAILDLKDLRAVLAHISDHAATHGPLRQCVKATIRNDTAPAAVLDNQGCEQILRRAALTLKDFIRTDRGWPRLHQYSGCRQAHGESAALRNISVYGYSPKLLRNCPRSATSPSPSCASSSTRRIFCSPMPRRLFG